MNTVLTVLIILVVISPLVPFSASSIDSDSSTDSSNCNDIEDVDTHVVPDENAIPSDISWKFAAVTNLYNDPYGTANTPSNLASDDGSLCRLTEEYSSGYRLDLRFRTATAVYAHQFLDHELRMEFTQVWSLGPEDLKFYVCLADAGGNEGTYTYVGQLSSPGVYTFPLDQSILYRDSIESARHLFVRVLGAIETSDGTGNSYDFDFLGFAYHAHVPRLADWPEWDAAKGGSYLYPHYGINRNYAVFSATYLCYDGGSELTSFEYNYYDQMQLGGWTVSYLTDHYDMDYVGEADSSWASLVPSACTISTTSTSRTFTFGVLIEWSHPKGHGYSTPNTYTASTSEASSSEGFWEYYVNPDLSMQITPTITESCVPRGTSCTYSGDIYYTGSSSMGLGGYISPLASEVDIQVRRTIPSSTGWTYTAQPATDGTFTVLPNTDSSTSGTNTFELRVVADGESTNLLSSTLSDTVILSI